MEVLDTSGPGSNPGTLTMNKKEFEEKIEAVHVSWNCIHRYDQHEVGCPHKDWTKEELLSALISKKKFEQSGLRGMVLT